MFTDRDLLDQVLRTLDGNEDDFDTQAIVDEIQSRYGLVDIDTIDSSAYWDIVARHTH
jgi:hypothetical protein